ncbi:MAG: hypothetical protein IJ292_05565 [Clostridia bacterium]|nr:hypothetical protein [Clostridia bacterium]
MDNLIENIKKNWLKWESLPFVFAIILMFYIGIASEVNDWTGINMGGKEYFLLSIPFLVLFLLYVVWCVIHITKEKKNATAVECTEEQAKSKKTKKTIWLVSGVCAAVLAIALLILFLISGNNGADRDGKYVIWADEYHIALTPEVHKSYYLSGCAVGVKGGKLTDYPKQCVFELDFKDDDTFTITCNGKFLGVTPDKNGVGYSASCTSITWELEEVEEGLYYIRNVDENTYLKWYDPMQNWTTHHEISDEYQSQYLLRLEKVN